MDRLAHQNKRLKGDKDRESMDWMMCQAIIEMERLHENIIHIKRVHEDAEVSGQLNRLMTEVSIKRLEDRIQWLENRHEQSKK
jgi:hypothetical protein